jgi:hypothetical protein
MAKGLKKTTRSRKATKQSARSAAAASAILVGVVQDATTRVPINRAMVKIVGGSNFGKTAYSNAVGLYALKNLKLGRNLIEASKGARVQEKDKTLVAGLNIQNFVL